MITTQTQTKTYPPAESAPVIDEVFDPVTGRRDGKILSCAPVLFTGRNLLRWGQDGRVCFHLSPVEQPERLIPVEQLYRYENTKILVQMPSLDEGQYRLVAEKAEGEGDDDGYAIYPFPAVFEVKDLSLGEIILQRRQRQR